MPANHPQRRRALRRPATLVASVAVATTALLTLAPAAQATTRTGTTLVVSPWRATRNTGAAITYTFTLAHRGVRIPGKTIVIYTHGVHETAWVKRWTRTLNSNGQVSLTFNVTRSLDVSARFGGTAGYAPSTSSIAVVTAVDPFGSRVVTEASHHAGAPYQYGAAGPTRFDCSGLTRYVFGRFGKTLPHNSGQQYSAVRHIAKSSARPGDLIFLYGSGGIYHVGIYAGSGYMWHAPHSGTVVRKAQIWTSSYYVGRVG